jgi:hypothetical protein
LSELTAQQVLADWEAALDRQGETIEIGRQTGTNPNNVLRVQCRARVKGYRPDALVGETLQGEVMIRAYYPDLADNGFPLPVRNSDHVVVRGVFKSIHAVDNNTGRVGNTQIFVKIMAMG